MCHIFRQKPAVGTGISDQFLFIEVLRVVQRSAVPCSQAHGWLLSVNWSGHRAQAAFLFSPYIQLSERLPPNSFVLTASAAALVLKRFACSRKTIQSNLNCVEQFRLECEMGSFSHNSHSKGRGHNTTNIQGLPVKGRKKSSSVNTNNPVGSFSTQCCFIQSIIFRSRPEIFKALLDCYIFHRGNPKPLKRLFCTRLCGTPTERSARPHDRHLLHTQDSQHLLWP